MRAILDIVMVVLNLYMCVVIAWIIVSGLIAFGVVNTHNDLVRAVRDLLLTLTEPVLRPIRKFLPNTGGIDISPAILMLAVVLLGWIMLRLPTFG